MKKRQKEAAKQKQAEEKVTVNSLANELLESSDNPK